MPTESPIFDPTPEVADFILHHLGSTTLSFHDLATHCGKNAPALAAWMTRPDIRERIAAIDSGAATHARLAATTNLSAATAALVKVLRDFVAGQPTADPENAVGPASDRDSSTTSELKVRVVRLRENETARRAAGLLYRIARFTPLSTREMIKTRQPDQPGEATQASGTSVSPVSTSAASTAVPLASASSAGQLAAPLDLEALASLLDQLGIPDLAEPAATNGYTSPTTPSSTTSPPAAEARKPTDKPDAISVPAPSAPPREPLIPDRSPNLHPDHHCSESGAFHPAFDYAGDSS